MVVKDRFPQKCLSEMDEENTIEAILGARRAERKPPVFIPRSRSLEDLPGGIRVPVVKRQEPENRLRTKLQATVAGLKELDFLRETHEKLVHQAKLCSSQKRGSDSRGGNDNKVSKGPMKAFRSYPTSRLTQIREEVVPTEIQKVDHEQSDPQEQDTTFQGHNYPSKYGAGGCRRPLSAIMANTIDKEINEKGRLLSQATLCSSSSDISSSSASCGRSSPDSVLEVIPPKRGRAQSFCVTMGTGFKKSKESEISVDVENKEDNIQPKLRRASLQCEGVLTNRVKDENLLPDVRSHFNYPSPLHAVLRQFDYSKPNAFATSERPNNTANKALLHKNNNKLQSNSVMSVQQSDTNFRNRKDGYGVARALFQPNMGYRRMSTGSMAVGLPDNRTNTVRNNSVDNLTSHDIIVPPESAHLRPYRPQRSDDSNPVILSRKDGLNFIEEEDGHKKYAPNSMPKFRLDSVDSEDADSVFELSPTENEFEKTFRENQIKSVTRTSSSRRDSGLCSSAEDSPNKPQVLLASEVSVFSNTSNETKCDLSRGVVQRNTEPDNQCKNDSKKSEERSSSNINRTHSYSESDTNVADRIRTESNGRKYQDSCINESRSASVLLSRANSLRSTCTSSDMRSNASYDEGYAPSIVSSKYSVFSDEGYFLSVPSSIATSFSSMEGLKYKATGGQRLSIRSDVTWTSCDLDDNCSYFEQETSENSNHEQTPKENCDQQKRTRKPLIETAL